MDFGSVLVGLTKAVAWPLAVVVVALSLKGELIEWLLRFLRRKVALKLPGGIEATIDAEQQQEAAENPAGEKLPVKAPLEPSPRAAVNSLESRLRSELQEIDADKKEPVLLRALAISRLEAGHEFVYRQIYGSQIEALKRLNVGGKATLDQAREFFESYSATFPEIYANYNFDGWLNFLKINLLISQDADTLSVTDIARDFLVYLTDRRLTESKPG